MAIFSDSHRDSLLSRIFGIYDGIASLTFSASKTSLIPSADSLFLSILPSLPTPSLSDFRSGVAGCFLLVFIIVSSVSIIVTTVNNNIYNYSYKYKKKHKLLNQISNWKKKKQNFRQNTSIDLLRDILLLFSWNNRTKKKKNCVNLLLSSPLLRVLLLRSKNDILLLSSIQHVLRKWKTSSILLLSSIQHVLPKKKIELLNLRLSNPILLLLPILLFNLVLP